MWWRSGVLYQIYPRSFADSNGDGIGDLPGIISRLDHLAWLGVDGIWLSPITVSPNADWGYDVADYCDVDPDYGTLDDVDTLVAEAGARGIRVVLDLVPNHSSDRHPWFLDARSSRSSRHRNWYVWADRSNNWVSSFGGPAWTLDETTGQYYLHNFTAEQPDLNWWNREVRDAFDDILRFWFDRGIAGFRIDVCHGIVKDALLRDNPPATPDDHWMVRMFGQKPVFNANRPETHDLLRRWRRLADTYDPPRLLLGETLVHDVETMATYYGDGTDELGLAYNHPFLDAPFDAPALRAVVETTEGGLPPGAWPLWTGSNHDVSRLATRWAEGSEARARVALLMLLTLRGTPLLYQGDEIGLTDTPLTRDDIKDPVGVRFWPGYAGRDPVRTPLPWNDRPGGGFTEPGVKPWLPLAGGVASVEVQRNDAGSMLTFVRDLIALRRSRPDLTGGEYASRPAPAGAWVWRRGKGTVVALNLSDDEVAVEEKGRVLLSTGNNADLRLAPWSGCVIESSG
jgi:alpha-glucosidase